MKAIKKSLLITGAVSAVSLGGLATAGIASAETTSTSSDPMSSLVDKISSTFNIDKTKVQQVFDEERTAREAEREKMVSTKLQTLVDNKAITAAQKSVIEAKLTEMKKEREADRSAMQSLSDEERKAKMDEKKTELENWAKEQGLDLSKLKEILGGPGRGGPRGL